ncbi:MAG: hypothetical protein HKN41_11110 [Ilumatobacter sp.]|nr:hypothetical protein [Ilumatobacter sp.]
MPDHATAPDRRSRWRAYAIVTVVVWLGRWWFSADRRVTHISPDEPSQLAIARWLAGGRWNMFDHATWQPMFGTLLSPVYWFTDDAETVVRTALALNAFLGGLAAAVLVVLLGHLTPLSQSWCAVIAIVVGVAPSSLSGSSFLWAESLVSLTFVGAIVLTIRAHESGRWQPALGAIAMGVAGYTSHSRLLPFAVTTIAVVVGWELWRRRWRRAASLAGAAIALAGLSVAYTRWLLANIWDDPTDQNTVGAVWRRAQDPLQVGEAVIGQLWYQLAATFCLFGAGAVLLVRALWRHSPDGIDTVAARLVVVGLVPQLALSAVFMSDRSRSDQLIYGRYNDAVVWPIVALGVAWVGWRFRDGLDTRHRWITAGALAGLIGTGVAVEAWHGDAIRESYGVRSMIPGLLAFVDGNDVLDPARVTATTASIFLLLVALIALAQVRDARPLVVAVTISSATLLFAVGVVRFERVADLRLNGWLRASAVREIEAIVPDDAPLGVRPVRDSEDPVVRFVPQRQRFQLYQLYLPDRTFLRDRGVDDDVGPYVFAPLRDPELTEAGAQVIWFDRSLRIGLWEEPRREEPG